MKQAPRLIGQTFPLPGSPLSEYAARINDELAAGLIPAGCPHPAAAARLYLPFRALCCEDCEAATREAVSAQEPECAICSAAAAGPAVWLAGRVLVMAMLCRRCQTTGNVSRSPN